MKRIASFAAAALLTVLPSISHAAPADPVKAQGVCGA